MGALISTLQSGLKGYNPEGNPAIQHANSPPNVAFMPSREDGAPEGHTRFGIDGSAKRSATIPIKPDFNAFWPIRSLS